MAGKRPVAAILYDFDRTLCTKDMQEYQFIPSVGMEPADFWGLANSYAEEEHMDKILSYMYIMIKKSQECGIPLTRKSVMECGRAIELYKGLVRRPQPLRQRERRDRRALCPLFGAQRDN